MSDSATPWITARRASLSITISRNSLRLTSIESVMPSSHLILGRPLLPPIHPSIRVSSNESTLCMRWPKYWSFSLFLAISKARFDFQKQAAYHQQICHNEHCKSLSLRIHKTNHKVPTCGFLIRLSQTQLRRQDIHMVYHWQFFIKTTQQYHRKKICD